MRDVLKDLMAIWRTGGTAGVGTVVRTFASAPRPPGASMVVAPDGTVSGPVSGGQRRGTGMEVFVSSHAPRPRMLVFGAIDFAAAVAQLGSFLGYRVTVCDARAVLATRARFPTAEVVVDWPHRYLAAQAETGAIDGRTVICVLTHDPKFDVPVLQVAHPRRPHGAAAPGGTDRRRAGPAGQPDRAGPGRQDAGGDRGSITAEIIASRWGGGGRPLAETGGRIHHEEGSDEGEGEDPGGSGTELSDSLTRY